MFIRNSKVKRKQERNEVSSYKPNPAEERGPLRPEAKSDQDRLARAPVLKGSCATAATTPYVRQAHNAFASHLIAPPNYLIQQCQGRSHTSTTATAHT